MKKLLVPLFLLIIINSFSFAATLNSIDIAEFKKSIVGNTLVSVSANHLNGRFVNSTVAIYIDDKGNIFGKYAYKLNNVPQIDKGIYSLGKDGTIYITWQHWYNAKKVCVHLYETQNAIISISCDNIFHTVFMKSDTKPGNHL